MVAAADTLASSRLGPTAPSTSASPSPPPPALSEHEGAGSGGPGSGSTTPRGAGALSATDAMAMAPPPPLPAGGRRRLGRRGCPVPLVKARDLLLEAVQELPGSPCCPCPCPSGHPAALAQARAQAAALEDPSSSSASSPESTPRAGAGGGASCSSSKVGGVVFLRLEVPVSDVEDEEDALVWLRAQPSSTQPRVFFRVPERSLVAAGLGAAHLVKGGEELGAGYAAALGFERGDGGGSGGVPEGVTYYGGGRFDPLYPRPSSDWEGFGTAYLVLPALELVLDRRRKQQQRGGKDGKKDEGHDDGEESGRQSPETQLQEPRPPSPPSAAAPAATEEAAEEEHDGFVLAVNLRFRSWAELAASRAALLGLLRDACVDTAGGDGDDEGGDALLPAPVSCEEPSQFEAWHDGIGRALAAMRAGEYRKVVLARAAQFTFPRRPRPLDLVLRLRAHYGYLFCLQLDADRAFLGCTPEQLFKVQADGTLSTEALAGTRPRGATPEEDERLGAELMASSKDRFENRVTAESIEEALRPLALGGRVERDPAFVLRLRHVQHICHKISARLAPDASAASPLDPAFRLLAALHPTPAVAGEPRRTALQAIRALEPFDRGFYAGPVGYVSPTCAEFAVAIRSVLLVGDRAHVFAGAGIVPGSTAEGEWAEIGAKMANFVRMFPAPAAPLRSLPNLATLWATLVVEELARNGVTHFCVAPGSRSTPLVTAAARHPHTTLMVHHDERGAGFYCLGYARAKGRPAAVIVTSGTAVANLLPAAVEAATDRVPMLLLTADRPPEARDCGANQTVTQPGMFATCARWAKDFPCPTHEVLAASLLSDIDYAVSVARGVDPGPVHLNFQLRENLAPEGGVVRDAAVPGLSSEWSDACLGDRRFAQWERSLRPYTAFPRLRPACPLPPDLLAALRDAKRGLLVLGRLPQRRDRAHARWLVQALRWPAFADIGSGLRGDPALRPFLVGPYEALLADPVTSAALDPDCVLQVGAPLVSKRLPKFLVACRAPTLVHVVPSPARRDPELAATHHVCADIPTFVRALDAALATQEGGGHAGERHPSGLLPLLQALAARVEGDVEGELGPEPAERPLTEPMVAHLVTRCLPKGHGLFLSNSMPVRDVDAFAFAGGGCGGGDEDTDGKTRGLPLVAMNRGASGIDGILSTAMGYAAGLGEPVTLLVGDMACLHDLNALHGLAAPPPPGSPPPPPVTVVLVNNGGGGIFSFLPIARHADVFSPYFDSPHDLEFGPVVKAFGLPYRLCRSAGDFVVALAEAQAGGRPAVLEVVTDRAQNVRVHRSLGAGMRASLHAALAGMLRLDWARAGPRGSKPSLLLLHGFLGCKEDWAPFLWPGAGRLGGSGSGTGAAVGLAQDYDCLAVDLPGHGGTTVDPAGAGGTSAAYSLPVTALALVRLLDRLGIARVAVVGYSMGGRLAAYLAQQYPERVSALVVASAHPGLRSEGERLERREEDRRLAERLGRAQAQGGGEHWDAFLRWWYGKPLWGRLAERAPAYPRMLRRRRASLERSEDPGGVARALLGMSVAQQPGLWDFIRSGHVPTLVAYGAADVKYAALGEELRGGLGMAERRDGGGAAVGGARGATRVEVKCIDDAGHAVLTEKEPEVLREVTAFLRRHLEDPQQAPPPVAAAPAAAARVAGLSWAPFALPLRRPMTLSAGGTMAERRGLLVVLRSDSGAAGVGEVSPLPGFSPETLPEAERQLKEVAKALGGKPLPRALAGWGDWLKGVAASPSPLLPSVRAGLEMALVHLLAQQHHVGIPAVLVAGRPHLLHTGRVRLNGLALRQQQPQQSEQQPPRSSSLGGTKVKVGGRPVEEDVARVNAMLAALGPGERIRLDANQAWCMGEATRFLQGLAHPERVEYIEEPCADPLCLPELHHRAGQRVRFALDESLAAPPRPLAELVGMPGLAALVLKPTVLGGMGACLDLHALAAAKGLAAVVSSSFESSVGLCHLTLLASVLNPQGAPPSSASLSASASSAGGAPEDGSGGATLHGLATYTAFAEEPMLQREGDGAGYGTLVYPGARSLLVDVLGCQELLDAHVRPGRNGGGGGGRSSSPGAPEGLALEDGSSGKPAAPAAPERAGMENGSSSSSSSSSSDRRKRQGSP